MYFSWISYLILKLLISDWGRLQFPGEEKYTDWKWFWQCQHTVTRCSSQIRKIRKTNRRGRLPGVVVDCVVYNTLTYIRHGLWTLKLNRKGGGERLQTNAHNFWKHINLITSLDSKIGIRQSFILFYSYFIFIFFI